MKAHFEYQNARSVSLAIKKTSSLAEVGCREHRATTVTSRSSFLLEEPERKIPRGYCRGIGPWSPLFRYIMDLEPRPRTEGVQGG